MYCKGEHYSASWEKANLSTKKEVMKKEGRYFGQRTLCYTIPWFKEML